MKTYKICLPTKDHLSKRTWYCSLCDKNMNVNRETGHINSIFHKRRERFAFTAKQYEFDNPEFNQIGNMLKDVIKDCKDNYFHTFEYRCEYDMNFENKTSGEVFHFTKIMILNYSRPNQRDCSKKMMNTKKIVRNSKN